MTLKEEIVQLRALQGIDLRIAKLDEEIIGESVELDTQRESIEKRKTIIVELQEKITANEGRHRELEAELEDELTRIKNRQSKLMNIQTNREYQSLLKEIEDGKNVNKQRENDIVQLMEHLEQYQVKLEGEIKDCEAEEKLLGEVTQKVTRHAVKLRKQKTKIEKERQGKVKEVAAGILKKYDLLRHKRNGLAVVGVTAGVCHGCHMNIPPQLYNNLLKDNELFSCPTCNRIIFSMPEISE